MKKAAKDRLAKGNGGKDYDGEVDLFDNMTFDFNGKPMEIKDAKKVLDCPPESNV